MVIKRIGKCQPKMCGAFCCRVGPHLIVKDANVGSKTYKLYDMFLWKTETFPGKKSDVISYPDQKCSNLRGLKCLIHKEKPTECKVWPVTIDNWYRLARQNGCTYRFKKVVK